MSVIRQEVRRIWRELKNSSADAAAPTLYPIDFISLDCLAHRLIILDYRNQGLCFWHTNSRTWVCESNDATRSEALERGVMLTVFQEG